MRVLICIFAAQLLIAAALLWNFAPAPQTLDPHPLNAPAAAAGRPTIFVVTPAGVDLETLYEQQPPHIRSLIESRYRLRFVEATEWPVVLEQPQEKE